MSRDTTSRRKFLKIAGASAAVLAGGALGLYSLVTIPKNRQQSATTSVQASSSATTASSSSASSTNQNIPLVVRDLNQEIQAYLSDLTKFGNGEITNSEMKADSPTYRGLLQNAEILREALKKYEPQNTESQGQRHRLDQIALGSLSLYSWSSRMLEDDIGPIPPILDNFSALRGCAQTILANLEYDLHPENTGDERAVANIGKTFTDVKNETDIAPLMRNKFKAIYDALSPDARASLKQMIESYNPNADAIGDYKKISEENLGILGLNRLLSRHEFTLDDEYRTAAITTIENGTSRGSSLGKIANRSNTPMTMLDQASAENWKDKIMSAYSELPSNHREMTNYDLALALMNTPTFINLRNDFIKDMNPDPIEWQRMERMFTAVYSLADRDSYFINLYRGDTWWHNTGIEDKGKYFWTDFWESPGKIIGTPPSLRDISSKDFGYGGYRQYYNWIVAKNLFGWTNTIPVFIYSPGKGIVVSNT
jgi:hypothetical protein